jgi:hypothetical protein
LGGPGGLTIVLEEEKMVAERIKKAGYYVIDNAEISAGWSKGRLLGSTGRSF